MERFLLLHQHPPDRCAASWEAWKCHPSPLRGAPVLSTCLHGGHAVWWEAEAASAEAALTLLPAYVARRTRVVPVRRVVTP